MPVPERLCTTVSARAPPREERPGVGSRGARKGLGKDLNLESTLTRVDPLDTLAHHVDGAFVLVVKVTGGRYRRRCFLTAAAAENAARRATDKGESATVYLCELRPLWKLRGGVDE